jgi:hypothetical protein
MKSATAIRLNRKRHLTPMTCFGLGLLALMGCSHARADDATLCGGDARLKSLEGRWALASFKEALVKLRSWDAAMRSVSSSASISAVTIEGTRIGFNYSWHEGNVDPNYCVRTSGGKLWARTDASATWDGPYVLLGSSAGDEASLYLKEYFVGCFTSEQHERWCLAPSGISIDGKKIPAALQMDLSEGPSYGTSFQVDGQTPPFLVFVPRTNGWAVYKDDWETTEGHVPVDPTKDKPWRTLTR